MSTFVERAASRRARGVARLSHDLRADDRSFDLEFWQARGHEAIFAAAWEMVLEYRRFRGEEGDEPRLQRQVGGLVRRGGEAVHGAALHEGPRPVGVAGPDER
jgi:hypothetical protein